MSDPIEKSTTALERAKIPLPKFLKKNHYFGFLGILLVYLLAGTYSEYSQTIMNTINVICVLMLANAFVKGFADRSCIDGANGFR